MVQRAGTVRVLDGWRRPIVKAIFQVVQLNSNEVDPPRTPSLINVSPRNDLCRVTDAIFHNVTNPVRSTCTPGSVGTVGGQPPWVTRPT